MPLTTPPSTQPLLRELLGEPPEGVADVDGEPGLPDQTELPLTVIEPPRGWQLVSFRELWQFRELIYFLTWRDVKVRYKQTLLGAAWAVLQPAMMMVVFTIFFRRMAGVPSGDMPYPVFVFAGLLPWTFFSNAITAASQSVVGNQNLVTKVYFPRLIIPLGAAGAGLVDLVIAFGMLLALMLCCPLIPGWGGVLVPGWGVLLLPVVLFGLVVAAVGMGALLAALTVAYRDFRYVVPFMMQVWMFATPSIYMDPDAVPASGWRVLLPLNPVYGLVSSFRHAVLGGPIDAYGLAVALALSCVLLVIGCAYFRRVEQSFADVI
jgi:lipopolysaccharide transport system permease protein